MPDERDISVSATAARRRFSDIFNRAAYGKERIVLTMRDKGMVAMVPVEDLELLEEIEDRLGLEEARKALAEVEQEGAEAWEEVKAELGL